MTLFRLGIRELARTKGRAALIALILALQASVLGGGLVGSDSLVHTRDTYFDDLHFADLEIQFVAAADTEMPTLEQLRAIDGVSAVSRRFLQGGYIERDGQPPLQVIVQYLEPGEHDVNQLDILEGRALQPGSPHDAVIDRSLANDHGISPGDTLVVNPYTFSATFEVAGVATSPEHLVPTASPDLIVPLKGSLGVIYASREQLDELFVDQLYNSLLFEYEQGADPDATRAAIENALSGLDIERIVPRESNFAQWYLDEILSGARMFIPFLAALLAFMAGIVVFMTLNRLIANRRREIGVLLAMGHSPMRLFAVFLPFGLIPGLFGALGGILGACGYGLNFATLMGDNLGMPAPIMAYSAIDLAIGAGSALVVGIVSVTLPLISATRLRPADALRGAGNVRFSGLGALDKLAVGRPSVRYALRNLLRRLRLSFATMTLIALAITLPASLLTIVSSWKSWAEADADRGNWDSMIAFRVALEPDVMKPILQTKGVVDFEPYTQAYATLYQAGSDPQEVRVRGLSVPARVFEPELVAGEQFSSVSADEAIVNETFVAGNRPARVGDTIHLEAKGERYAVRVVGLVRDNSVRNVYVPMGLAQKLLEKPDKISGVYVTLGDGPPPIPPDSDEAPTGATSEDAEVIDLEPEVTEEVEELPPLPLRQSLLTHDFVSSLQMKEDVGDAMVEYISGIYIICLPFIIIGAALGALFLLSVLGLLLLEREPEYATLSALGYAAGAIRRSVAVEVAILAVGGVLLSLLGWWGFTLLFNAVMAKSFFAIPLDFQVFDYLVVAIPTLVFLAAAALPGTVRLGRLDLAATLRARGIG